MRILKYIISLLLAIPCTVFAQERDNEFLPSEITFGADIVHVVQSLKPNQSFLDIQSRVNFSKFYLAVGFGTMKLAFSESNYAYQSEGSYFRIGSHVNFIPYNKNRSSLFFGLMYGHASFQDEVQYQRTGNKWNNTNIALKNGRLTASWFEVNTGVVVRLTGAIHLGWTMRLKFAKNLSGNGELQPYKIPGFGEFSNNNNFGINYYLIYKLKLQNKSLFIRKIKITK